MPLRTFDRSENLTQLEAGTYDVHGGGSWY